MNSLDKSSIIFFDKNAKPTDNEKTGFAKEVVCVLGDDMISRQYFVLFDRGQIIDPFGIDSNKSTKNTKYKKVSEDTFNNYLRYLKTKNSIYFTRARRTL